MKEKCLLCKSEGEVFYDFMNRKYYRCNNCQGIFVPADLLPDPVFEMERYSAHNNDIEDVRYQNFVSPIVNKVLQDFNPLLHWGLDFGAGPGPVISDMLQKKGFSISAYDPFFHDDKDLLKSQYDFVVCCEVMEHFHNPLKEFKLIKKLLLPKGKLYCMTHLYSPELNFNDWYYKNDPTHVFIYQKETIEFIRNLLGFKSAEISNRLIVFTT